MPSHGDLIDSWQEGPVKVLVRHSCVQRDLYELLVDGAFPPALRDELSRRGEARGSPLLYVVDVPGSCQITVAPARGRAVVMPRMTIARTQQRADAEALAKAVRAVVEKAT